MSTLFPLPSKPVSFHKPLFSIGFAGKNAQQFFTTLADAGVERILDVRLHNTSQLAGYT